MINPSIDRVRAIGLYIEGLEDGNALGSACWHALEKGIPVVAIKGGDTAEAEAVAISHTSAMVVERDLWQAFCERYGIVEVSSPKALVETLKFLTVGGVKLALDSPASVDKAVADIIESARKAVDIELNTFLVESMVADALIVNRERS